MFTRTSPKTWEDKFLGIPLLASKDISWMQVGDHEMSTTIVLALGLWDWFLLGRLVQNSALWIRNR